MACVVDAEPVNWLTPLTSMFLHGGWGHLIGNALFLWVFGNNIEDSMGRARFLVFYLLCGFAADAAQVFLEPASPIPMVGASGAISGVMGAYLVLYPRVMVNMLFIFVVIVRIIPLPAWVVLIYWFGLQIFSAAMELGSPGAGGVAFMAHIGGFVAGAALVKVFENRRRVAVRTSERHRLHPDHP
jgi:membrane associated rhomboid family serine protease